MKSKLQIQFKFVMPLLSVRNTDYMFVQVFNANPELVFAHILRAAHLLDEILKLSETLSTFTR
jgi:hypothetical protein